MANIPGMILKTVAKSASKKQFISSSKQIYKIANSKGRLYNTDFYYKRSAFMKERDAKIFKNRLSIAKEILSIRAYRHPFTNYKKLKKVNSYMQSNKALKSIDGVNELVNQYMKNFRVTNFERRMVENFGNKEDGFTAYDIKKSDSMRHYFNFQATTVKTDSINTKDAAFLTSISKDGHFTKDDVLDYFKNKSRFNESDYFSTQNRIYELCDKGLIINDGKKFTFELNILEKPQEVNSLNDMIIYYFSQNNRINFEDMKSMHETLEYKFTSYNEFKNNIFEATSKLCDDGFLIKSGFTYSLTQVGKEYFESANKHINELNMDYIQSKLDFYSDLDLLVKVDQRFYFSEKFMKIMNDDKKERLGHSLNFDSTHKEIMMKVIECSSIVELEKYIDLNSTSNLKKASYSVKLDELIDNKFVGRGKNDSLYLTDLGYESLKLKRESPLSFSISDMQFFRIDDGNFTFEKFKSSFNDDVQFQMTKQRLFKLVDANIFKFEDDRFVPTKYGLDLKSDFEERLKEVNFSRRFNTFDIDELKHNIFKWSLEHKNEVNVYSLMHSTEIRKLSLKIGHAKEPFEMNDLDAMQIRNMFVKYNENNSICEYLRKNHNGRYEAEIVIKRLNDYLDENLNKGRFNAYILRDKLSEIMNIPKDDELLKNDSEWFKYLKYEVYKSDYFSYEKCFDAPSDFFTEKRFKKLVEHEYIDFYPADSSYILNGNFKAEYEIYLQTFKPKKKEIILLNEAMSKQIDLAAAIEDGKIAEGRVNRLVEQKYISIGTDNHIIVRTKGRELVNRKLETILSLHLGDLKKFNYITDSQISDRFVANYFSKTSFKKDKLHDKILKVVEFNKTTDADHILNVIKFDVNKDLNSIIGKQKIDELVKYGYLNAKDNGHDYSTYKINRFKYNELLKPKEVMDLLKLNSRDLLSFDDIRTLDMIFRNGKISDRNIKLYKDMLDKLIDNDYIVQDKNQFSVTSKFNREYVRLISDDVKIKNIKKIGESINHVVNQHYYNAELKSCFYSDIDVKGLLTNLNFDSNDIVKSVSNDYFKIEKDVGFSIGVSNHKETQLLRIIVDRDGNLKSAYPINTLTKDYYKSFSDVKLNMYDYNNIIMNASDNVLNLSNLEVSYDEMKKIKSRVNNLESAGYLELLSVNEYRLKDHFRSYIDDIKKIKDGELSETQRAILNDLSRFYNITHSQISKYLVNHHPQTLYNIEKIIGKDIIQKNDVIIDGVKESVYTLTPKGIKFVEKNDMIDNDKTFKSKLHSRPEELKHDLYVYSAYKHFENSIEKQGGKVINSLTDKDMRSFDMKSQGQQRVEYSDIYIEYELSNGERHFANLEVDCGYDKGTILSKAQNIDNLVWYTNTGAQATKIEKVVSKSLVFTITL